MVDQVPATDAPTGVWFVHEYGHSIRPFLDPADALSFMQAEGGTWSVRFVEFGERFSE